MLVAAHREGETKRDIVVCLVVKKMVGLQVLVQLVVLIVGLNGNLLTSGPAGSARSVAGVAGTATSVDDKVRSVAGTATSVDDKVGWPKHFGVLRSPEEEGRDGWNVTWDDEFNGMLHTTVNLETFLGDAEATKLCTVYCFDNNVEANSAVESTRRTTFDIVGTTSNVDYEETLRSERCFGDTVVPKLRSEECLGNVRGTEVNGAAGSTLCWTAMDTVPNMVLNTENNIKNYEVIGANLVWAEPRGMDNLGAVCMIGDTVGDQNLSTEQIQGEYLGFGESHCDDERGRVPSPARIANFDTVGEMAHTDFCDFGCEDGQ